MIGNIRSLFPLTIYTAHAGLSEDTKTSIVKHIDACVEASDNKDKEYTWTGDVNGHHDLQHNPIYEPVIQTIELGIQEYMSSIGYPVERYVPYITRCWGVKQTSTHTVPPHYHGSAHLSAVYYPSIAVGAGDFALTNYEHPNELFPTAFTTEAYEDGLVARTVHTDAEQYLTVEEDLLLIFPSKTKHRTTPNVSTEPRYSVTADIVLTLASADGIEHGLPPLDLWKKVQWRDLP